MVAKKTTETMPDALKLENQLCFPLYAASREVIKQYRPYLDAIDLTYTQYVAMMVVWEEGEISFKELGERLFLDSGTLTPVVKALAAKGFVSRERSSEDERAVIVRLESMGRELRDKAADIPAKVGSCIDLSAEEATQLHALLYKILDKEASA